MSFKKVLLHRLAYVVFAPVFLLATVAAMAPRTHATEPQVVTIGMPLDGLWAYNVPAAEPWNDDVGDSHPAAHTRIGSTADWMVDLYELAELDSTDVGVYFSGPAGTQLKAAGTWDSGCGGAGSGLKIDVYINATKIGQVTYAHLTNIDSNGSRPSNDGYYDSGSYIGEIITGSSSCYGGGHTHVEFDNQVNYSCYVDKGRPGATTIAAGTAIGKVGETGANAVKQVCPSGGSTVNLGQLGPAGVPKDDFALYRVESDSTGHWYVKKNENNTAGGYAINGWLHGSPGDIPFMGDFTKDKIDDVGIYRIENGEGRWYVKNGANQEEVLHAWGVRHGLPGDIPVAGDFDGDGYADFGIYRPNGGKWYVLNGVDVSRTIINGEPHGGWAQDRPVVGDFNGDNKDDFGIFRPEGGTARWYFKSSVKNSQGVYPQIAHAWGVMHGGWAQDLPVVGDFNGDNYDDFGVYRPQGGTGYWYVRSGVDVSNMFINGAQQGGWAGDVPLSGNSG